MFDLGPAARQLAQLVTGVGPRQLESPTPCREWNVADLLGHVLQFATVFAANARKEPPRVPEHLVEDWRRLIPAQLDDLADAWRLESAWLGRVSAGGVEMDAADNAVVAIEELTVHAWDLARATGQAISIDEGRLGRVDRLFELFGDAPFGPALVAPQGASRLEQTVARTGRDPAWAPEPRRAQ